METVEVKRAYVMYSEHTNQHHSNAQSQPSYHHIYAIGN